MVMITLRYTKFRVENAEAVTSVSDNYLKFTVKISYGKDAIKKK